VERAQRFSRNLATVASEISDGVPDAGLVDGSRPFGARFDGVRLRLAPIATVAGAMVVSLAIVAIASGRPQAPAGGAAPAFTSTEAAREALAPLGLICAQAGGGVVCEAPAPDHVHRATLETDGDGVTSAEVRIESTDGGPLVLDGVDDYFARAASAVLAPELAAEADGWIREAYAGCGAECSIELDGLDLSMALGSESVTLVLRER
jgi:hypothetical protein